MSEKEGTARVKLMLTPTANRAGDLFPLWVANHLTFTGVSPPVEALLQYFSVLLLWGRMR